MRKALSRRRRVSSSPSLDGRHRIVATPVTFRFGPAASYEMTPEQRGRGGEQSASSSPLRNDRRQMWTIHHGAWHARWWVRRVGPGWWCFCRPDSGDPLSCRSRGHRSVLGTPAQAATPPRLVWWKAALIEGASDIFLGGTGESKPTGIHWRRSRQKALRRSR